MTLMRRYSRLAHFLLDSLKPTHMGSEPPSCSTRCRPCSPFHTPRGCAAMGIDRSRLTGRIRRYDDEFVRSLRIVESRHSAKCFSPPMPPHLPERCDQHHGAPRHIGPKSKQDNNQWSRSVITYSSVPRRSPKELRVAPAVDRFRYWGPCTAS